MWTFIQGDINIYKMDTEVYTEIHRSLHILNLKFLQSNAKRDIVYMGWY